MGCEPASSSSDRIGFEAADTQRSPSSAESDAKTSAGSTASKAAAQPGSVPAGARVDSRAGQMDSGQADEDAGLSAQRPPSTPYDEYPSYLCSDRTADGDLDELDAGQAGTYAQVHRILQCSSCSNSFCHGASAGFSLQASRSEVYDRWLGADREGGRTGSAAEGGLCEGMRLVVPGEPDSSLLYLKLADQTPPCGSPMPPNVTQPSDPRLSADELDILYSWIAAGAHKDGG
jgi:hypothetical protein